MKCVGVLFDNTLSWKHHAKKVKTNYQELVAFYPDLKVVQHSLY